jgi:signal recognition particle receptor subunit beta
MVLFNYSTKELTAKIVYYGPGLCGKTTNLQWVHEKLPIKNKGKMLSLATETDRTLFFDFLPIELGTIRGMKTRVQLYTVPGQVFYNATRRMVLKGADCVVFVADSQEPMLEANVESWENMRQNLEANEIKPDEIPVVFQYNKRDLPNALPLEILNERLNPRGMPFHEAVAIKGMGVEESLKTATALVFRALAGKYGTPGEAAAMSSRGSGSGSGGTAPTPTPPAAAAPPAPAAAPARAPAPPPPLPPPPAPAEADDLLDGLEIHPHPEAVVEEELSLDDDVAPAAASARPRPGARDTVASPPREAEEIRRRIRTPTYEPEVFEAIDDEEEDIEELTLDAVGPGRAAAGPFTRVAEPPALADDTSFNLDFDGDAPEPPLPSVSAVRSAPPAPLRSVTPAAYELEEEADEASAAPSTLPPSRALAAAVVEASLDVPAGGEEETTVEVPVRLSVPRGVRELRINLRLVVRLDVKE